MKNHLIRLFLYVAICMVPLSCGTRKSATKILKNSEIVQESVKSVGESVKSEVKKEKQSEVVKAENINEDKSVIVTELFSEEGVIKSRVKEIKIGKQTNNTSNSKKSLKEAEIKSSEKWKIKTIRSNEITTVYKTKTVSSDRNGLYYAGSAVAIIGLLFWLKPWVK